MFRKLLCKIGLHVWRYRCKKTGVYLSEPCYIPLFIKDDLVCSEACYPTEEFKCMFCQFYKRK